MLSKYALILGVLLLTGCTVTQPVTNSPTGGQNVYVSQKWKVPVSSCVWCSSTYKLQVHHIIPQHVRPDLAMCTNNMVVLCRDCHFVLGHRRNYRTGMNTNIMNMLKEYR